MNIFDHISKLSASYGVPSQLMFAMAKVETNNTRLFVEFDPDWQAPTGDLTPDQTTDPEQADDPDQTTEPEQADDPIESIARRIKWGIFGQHGSQLREAGYMGPFAALLDQDRLVVHYALRTMQALSQRYLPQHGWAGVACLWHYGEPFAPRLGKFRQLAYVDELATVGRDVRMLLGGVEGS